jgi:D-alanine-D-alanine ligase
MSTNNRVVILHGCVPPDAEPDEQDVLIEVRQVGEALKSLGYETATLPLSLNLHWTARVLRELEPLAVFNLVESIEGEDRLLHLSPVLLDYLGIPYTGTGGEGMFLASNKLLAKRLMAKSGICTPAWREAQQVLSGQAELDPPFVVKSIWDNASRGLEDVLESTDRLRDHLVSLSENGRIDTVFVESYIEGREFNLSLLQNGEEVEVLPPAEMLFVDYPPDRPRIVGYAAKWDPASFEYQHTVRRFQFDAADQGLLDELRLLARTCWRELRIGGYARVDFRVDQQGRPWVLEINPNPCLSEDAGLAAAAAQAGLSYQELVLRIVKPVVENTAAASLSGNSLPTSVSAPERRGA